MDLLQCVEEGVKRVSRASGEPEEVSRTCSAWGRKTRCHDEAICIITANVHVVFGIETVT